MRDEHNTVLFAKDISKIYHLRVLKNLQIDLVPGSRYFDIMRKHSFVMLILIICLVFCHSQRNEVHARCTARSLSHLDARLSFVEGHIQFF
jgi:hypothetical protein